MRNLLFAGLMALLPFSAPAQDANLSGPAILTDEVVDTVMAAAIGGFIRPGYRDFREAAGRLTNAMDALCASPSSGAYEAAKAAFADTANSWARIEIVRVGPVIEQNRFERILFYPDRKSIGLKQVQALLAKPDDSATSPETLAGKSVAMQGLGALEYLLYGTGSETLASEKESFRCRYGAAIGGNVRNLAEELTDLWDRPDGIQQAWKHPGPDNPVFRNRREAITALLGMLVHGAETVRDQRIETFYKGAESAKFPRQALFWRSGNTWEMVKGNLEGLEGLMNTSGIVDLLNEDERSIISSIDFVLKSMIRVAGTIDPNVEEAVAEDTERQKLDFLLLNGRDLIARLNDSYGGAIGLTSGFSFSDGD
jgi:predicted lipoprotein